MAALIFIPVTVMIYWLLLPGSARRIFLLVASLAFISFLSPIYALYYLALVAVVYRAGEAVTDEKKKKWFFYPVLAFLVLNLCFFKYTGAAVAFLDKIVMGPAGLVPMKIPGFLLPLGLSFVTFRLIHYLVERYRGEIAKTSFMDLSLYALFFPTFIAGPVERFPSFEAQTTGMRRIALSQVNYGLWRILSGMVKKFIIADSMIGVIGPVLFSPWEQARGAVVLAVYGAAVWLYLDFGGYTDMAIGVSQLFGYRISENFDRPFFKKNIALYWRSWNMTVYSWIRDYFYLPFFAYRPSRLKTYAGIFCTMMVFMLWHAATINFLFAGIYNGLGLMAWKAFQDMKSRNHRMTGFFDRKALDPLAVLFTFTCVSFGIGIAFGAEGLGVLSRILGFPHP